MDSWHIKYGNMCCSLPLNSFKVITVGEGSAQCACISCISKLQAAAFINASQLLLEQCMSLFFCGNYSLPYNI